MATRIQLRRGTANDLSVANPVLAEGEPAFETNTRKIKVGDGSTSYVSLSYTVPAGGGSVGSATSDELSAVSAQAASAISVVRQSISVLSQAISVISQQVSLLSAAQSVLSQNVSVLSNQISNEMSMRSQSVSVASAAATSADAHASVASLAATSMGLRVDSVNSFISGISARSAGNVSTHGLQSVINALSNQISAIQTSTGFGVGQIRVVSTTNGITASVFTNISGLSLSMAASATYDVRGKVMWNTSTTQSVSFGFTYPAGVGPAVMRMYSYNSIFTAGFGDNFVSTAGIVRGYINDNGMSTTATAQLSISAVSGGGTYMVEIQGLIRTSTTAGTLQLQAAGGTTPGALNVLNGSYLQAYKIQ